MKTIKIHTEQEPDLTLSYIEREGNGLPIVFLHGSGFNKHVFDNQFQSELLANRHLISLDLPGQGNSSDARNPKHTYSYVGFAEIVNAFIAALGLEKVLIAGWSLGGQVAIEMIDSAPHFAGIMAFGAPPAPAGPLGIIRSMHFGKVMLLATKGQHTIDDAMYFEQATMHGYGNGKFMESLLRVDPLMRPNISRSLMLGSGQRERVENAQIPVCLLHGEQDGLVRSSYMQSLQSAALYRGNSIHFDHVGHAPFVEDAAMFDQLLAEFAHDVEAGRAGKKILDADVAIALAS